MIITTSLLVNIPPPVNNPLEMLLLMMHHEELMKEVDVEYKVEKLSIHIEEAGKKRKKKNTIRINLN
jgi:hypothetical protein